MPVGCPEKEEIWAAKDPNLVAKGFEVVEILAIVWASPQRKREAITFVDSRSYAASLYTDEFLDRYIFLSPHRLRPTEWEHLSREEI
jgi:hypothetical protein